MLWLAFHVFERAFPLTDADINRQLADPEVLEQLTRFGFEAAPSTPEQLADVIRAEEKKFAELVRRTGATAD